MKKVIKSVTLTVPQFYRTFKIPTVSMFVDGTGHPVKLGDIIYINGHKMEVKYGNHCDDSTNWLFPNEKGRMMRGWYAESLDGNWVVNLYHKKDQIVGLGQWMAEKLLDGIREENRYI